MSQVTAFISREQLAKLDELAAAGQSNRNDTAGGLLGPAIADAHQKLQAKAARGAKASETKGDSK